MIYDDNRDNEIEFATISKKLKAFCFPLPRNIFIYSLDKKFSKFSELHALFGIPGVIQGNIDFHRNVTSFQLDLDYVFHPFWLLKVWKSAPTPVINK